MLPAWATVAISLGAAVVTAVAALLGAFLSGRQERNLRLRDRRIDAASDFSASALKAIAAIRDTVRSLPLGDATTEETDRPAVIGLVHDAEIQALRVELLFGQSQTASEADKIKELLRQGERLTKDASLEQLRVGQSDIRATADRAEDCLGPFAAAARDGVEV